MVPAFSPALLAPIVSGPTDPGASDLAHRAYQQSAKRRHKAAAGPGSTGGGDTAAMMSEEDQLALALAMSVEVSRTGVERHMCV